MGLEMELPITVKCPHCGKEAIKVVIPLPIEKAMELIKVWKGK